MERDLQEHPSVNVKEESNSSPRKLLSGAGGGCDRMKRDEWSEGAVSSLLEGYESKWVLRNRAKLKGQDWEDVARHVSSRANSSKSAKTQTQCKNKIESMKKRYRSESASDHASSWPLFSRLHHLMRGTAAGRHGTPSPSTVPSSPSPVGPTKPISLVLLESSPPAQQPTPPPPPPPPPCFMTVETAHNSPKSNGADQIQQEERVVDDEEAKLSEQISDGNKKATSMETDSSTPALYGSKDSGRSNLKKKKKKKMEDKIKRKRRRVISCSSREETEMGIAQSIKLLAEAVVRSEKARMETLRDVERIRVEAEARRAEMELTRTQIMANTQLEIARMFAACCSSSAPANSLHSCPPS